ncbi:hypothetical protein EVAR_18555_1 [Eumeta japonica]|uniref:Uncharacterized protein n=1 Tax=Eumeta variegata TaxID=151549 RepID=A0A4C1V3Z2_EUMVA|nr:hypothetical protein EVAR_18555_1 [Eumeta japonica]
MIDGVLLTSEDVKDGPSSEQRVRCVNMGSESGELVKNVIVYKPELGRVSYAFDRGWRQCIGDKGVHQPLGRTESEWKCQVVSNLLYPLVVSSTNSSIDHTLWK